MWYGFGDDDDEDDCCRDPTHLNGDASGVCMRFRVASI